MACCLIGLGSNLGNREESLHQAATRLSRWPDVTQIALSRWRQTAPVGGPAGQGVFLNGAAVVETSLAPEALLAALLAIEVDLGRRPGERWGPRVVGLDLLLYDQLVLDTPALLVPHPRMAWRRFVLEPAAEVAPEMLHPTTGWTVRRLLDHLNRAIPYVAITGRAGAGKTWLAEQLVRCAGAEWITVAKAPAPRRERGKNRPGNAWSAVVEFLDRTTHMLAAELPQWCEPGRLWVSDFWFDQFVAYARVALGADRLDDFCRQWRQRRGRVIQPKLIVLVDPPPDQPGHGPPGECAAAGPESAFLRRVGQEIRAEAMQPGRGPVLRLGGSDRQAWLGEVLAAVEAMK